MGFFTLFGTVIALVKDVPRTADIFAKNKCQCICLKKGEFEQMPPELKSYQQKLSWVRAQLAHLRANSQAQMLERHKTDDAMVIGALGTDGVGLSWL